MKLATWNVNSVRARKARLLAWLTSHNPDILCLQETKTTDEHFPFDEVKALGYHVAHWGQKSYNGVALISKVPATELATGVAGDGSQASPPDEQARVIAGTFALGATALRVISVYVPNGGEVGSDKFEYKLAFLKQLATRVATEASRHAHLVVCGDMNVAPEDRDVHDPDAWREAILCSTAERQALATAMLTLADVVGAKLTAPGSFSWWDYRGLSFFKNLGLRIDHIFASPALAALCTAAAIDRAQRKGTKEDLPSDHAPVIAEFTVA